MLLPSFVSAMAVLATTASAAGSHSAAGNKTLSPIATRGDGRPTNNVTLSWGSNDTADALVQVGLSMNHTAVVLEDVPDVSAIVCTSDSVRVAFSSRSAFETAQSMWTTLGNHFVMVTNQLGDCDAKFERGFFMADTQTLDFDQTVLIATATVERTDIVGCTCKPHDGILFRSCFELKKQKRRGR